MNGSTQDASEQTGTITAKALLTAIRAGTDSIGIRGRALTDRPSYSDAFIFTVEAHKRGKTSRDTQTTTLDVPGYVSNGNTDKREIRIYEGRPYWRYCEAFRPTDGFWWLYSSEAILDVLEVLPSAAEVSFHVYLDAGTNENLIGADQTAPIGPNGERNPWAGQDKGFHGDHLYLLASYMVRGKRKERRYLISTTTGPHNSARFGWNRSA